MSKKKEKRKLTILNKNQEEKPLILFTKLR